MSSSTSRYTSSAESQTSDISKDNGYGEKYRNYRERNNRHVRKSREKKIAVEKEMRLKYAENEKRIEYLQSLAEDLTAELLSHQKQKKAQKKLACSVAKDKRPDWYGVPF